MCDGCLNLVDSLMSEVRGTRKRDKLFNLLFPRTYELLREYDLPTAHGVAYQVRRHAHGGRRSALGR